MDTPYSVVVREEVPSTQDEARARFDGQPVLVVAHRQTAGRGRGGSGWETAPRAMAASLAAKPGWSVDRTTLLPLLAGLAAARVLDLDVKWPNDVMRGDDKLGGILVEGSDGLVVAGFGLNLWWPDPPEGVGAVHDTDPGPAEAERVARAWVEQLLELIEQGPQVWPVDEYRRRCVTLGRSITWQPEGTGRAVDVAPDGALVVETPTGTERLHSGAIHHVRAR